MNNPAPDQIKQARLKSGLTQTKAGELIYYSLRAWQDWESGKRKMPPAAFELFEIKIGNNPCCGIMPYVSIRQ